MAVGRLVLAGLAAAGAYGVWRARQQAGTAARGLPGARGGGVAPSAAAGAAESATTLPDQSSPLPPDPTGGADSGSGVATTGSTGTAGASPAASAAAAAAQSATTLPDQSSPLPPDPTGGADSGGADTAGAGDLAASDLGTPARDGGAPDFTADTTALHGTTGGPERDALAVPSAYGADPAAGAGVEGTAGLHGSGTRGDDPLTGVTEPASDLPQATASPDGTPAAGPVETRRVGDDPA
jgi:hypothetical protein